MGLHVFTLAGIPVHVTLWYGVMLLLVSGGSLASGVTWAACLTVSLLVHEFGHGLVARHFGLQPAIVLHGWGGLCSHRPARRDRDDAWILLAGPGAGLLFGGVVWLAQRTVAGIGAPWIAHPQAAYVVDALLYINVGWGLVNLLPLWPLDGGQLFRLGALRVMRPVTAERVTHVLGLVLCGGAVAVGMLWWNSTFLTILALLLGWENLRRINAVAPSGPIRSQNRLGQELLDQAEEALIRGEPREAARLCHQARVDTPITDAQEGRLWTLLAVATVELGDYDEAEHYLKRAPDSALITRARARAILGRADRDRARELLADEDRRRHLHPEELGDLQALAES